MENRLNLLCQAGVIDQDICDGMLQVVRQMDTELSLPVFSEQGEMAVTHMANALMRSRRGEVIVPLDAELLEEMQQSTFWPQILTAHQALLQGFTVKLHANEEGYLLANLYGLWLAANEGHS